MGLHTGEPAVGEQGYHGVDVVRAARLSATGKGGQVLLSETTRALLGSALPDGVSVEAVGERHLKDMDEPERVYELAIDGVEVPRQEVPASGAAESQSAQPQVDELTKRLTEKINARVYEALERSLGKLGDKN
jgi:hypothetical protein